MLMSGPLSFQMSCHIAVVRDLRHPVRATRDRPSPAMPVSRRPKGLINAAAGYADRTPVDRSWQLSDLVPVKWPSCPISRANKDRDCSTADFTERQLPTPLCANASSSIVSEND